MPPLFVGDCMWSLFCNAVLSVLSSFAIINPERERWLLVLIVFLLTYGSKCSVSFPHDGLRSVNVPFPGNTH